MTLPSVTRPFRRAECADPHWPAVHPLQTVVQPPRWGTARTNGRQPVLAQTAAVADEPLSAVPCRCCEQSLFAVVSPLGGCSQGTLPLTDIYWSVSSHHEAFSCPSHLSSLHPLASPVPFPFFCIFSPVLASPVAELAVLRFL